MPASITLHPVDYALQSATVHAIRQTVFVQGQGIDPALERDDDDARALHLLACTADGQPVGTARLLIDSAGNRGQIGRMAVLDGYRGQGIGRLLLEQLCEHARQQGLGQLQLQAQLAALPLYLRAGFLPDGAQRMLAGQLHQPLHRRLDGTMRVSDEASAQAALASVISNTGRQLRLLAPQLDPGLLDAPLVLDSLRALASRREPLQIQLLVDEPAAITRRGGPVLALIQRLPSVFQLRQRDLERAAASSALAVNDRGYCLERSDATVAQGIAGLPWRPAAQRLHQQFEQHWAESGDCPELRPLRL